MNEEIVIFQDECGIQADLVREQGRIQDKDGKAQKLLGQKTATRHNKTGLIAGYVKLPDQQCYKYIATLIFDGTCDTDTFNFWINDFLLPDVARLRITYPDKTINLVMDNVPYHKSELTKDILAQNNINLIFQPPYSPDLNPIEPSWTHTKNDIRTQSYTTSTFQEKLCNSLNSRSW